MEITILLRCFSCSLFLYCLEAKSVSLNDLIAVEKQGSHQEIYIPGIIDHGKETSLLKSRKIFQIKSPLKPKKLKYLQKPGYRRKNITTKREIQGSNVKINQKYIPILRNIGLLFDNILSSDSSETYQFRHPKHKRNPFANKKDNICTCASKDDSEEFNTQEEAITYTSDTSNEVENTPVTATPPADNTIYDNFGRFGWNKNVPVLFERNPTGFRGNDSGLGERSSSTHNRCLEGYISGNNGNSGCGARNGDDASHSENYKENTDGDSRNDASSFGSTGRIRRIGTNIQNTEISRTSKNATFLLPADQTPEGVTGDISEHQRQMEFQIRRNETESPIFLSEFTSELRGKTKQENVPKRKTEDYEKNIPNDNTSDKRISIRNGQIATENKKNRRANETVGPKVVMIFDGYSVARDVNGENKMTERAIHIHS